MPVPPTTWQGSAPVTAHQLNEDLYSYDGSGYGANGINFHANKAILYAAPWEVRPLVVSTNGTHSNLQGTATAAYNVVDTAALFGLGADNPGYFGHLSFTPNLTSGNGSAGGFGGLYISFMFPTVESFAGTPACIGSDLYQGTIALPVSNGGYQKAFTAHHSAAFFLDLFDVSNNVYFPGVFLGASSGTVGTLTSSTTGTQGSTTRFCFMWQSVTTGGSTVPTLPTPQTVWGLGSSVTSTVLNGNSGIKGPLNFLNMPPALRCSQTTAQTISSSTPAVTKINFAGTTVSVDNYAGFSTANSTYTVPINGMYLVHAVASFNDLTSSIGIRGAGLTVNTNHYYGGGYGVITTGGDTGPTVTRVLDLQAGDTVSAFCWQNDSGSVNLSTNNTTRFLVAWMAGTGQSSPTWTPPDTTYRWQAGTPGNQLPALFQQHLANDLNFLIYKPYFTAIQTTAQSGFGTATAFETMTGWTVGGQVHSTNGDPYSGWSSGNNYWVAPVNGWYLCILECFATYSNSNVGTLEAGLYVPTSGGSPPPSPGWPPDIYQMIHTTQGSVLQPSATAMGFYYLLEGEYVQPQIGTINYTTTTWGTYVGTPGINSQFSVIWVCE